MGVVVSLASSSHVHIRKSWNNVLFGKICPSSGASKAVRPRGLQSLSAIQSIISHFVFITHRSRLQWKLADMFADDVVSTHKGGRRSGGGTGAVKKRGRNCQEQRQGRVGPACV